MSIVVKVSHAIPSQGPEIRHLPVIIHAVMIAVGSAQAQDKNIAALVEVPSDQIACEALKHHGSPVGGEEWPGGRAVAGPGPFQIHAHEQGRSKRSVPDENIRSIVSIIVHQVAGFAGKHHKAPVPA